MKTLQDALKDTVKSVKLIKIDFQGNFKIIKTFENLNDYEIFIKTSKKYLDKNFIIEKYFYENDNLVCQIFFKDV